MNFTVTIQISSQRPQITRSAIWGGIWGALQLYGTDDALVTSAFADADDTITANQPLPSPWGKDVGSIPIILSGTAFQCRVWQALAGLERGQLISYSALACKLGNPKATRAVASAVAANPLPVILPCHRVIRGDGSYGDYLGGMTRKTRLIESETLGAPR